MIGSRSRGVLEYSKLTVSALLTHGEKRTVLLCEGVTGLISAGAGNTNTDLRAQVLAAARH